jgi:ABC-2 type transport system permease protein
MVRMGRIRQDMGIMMSAARTSIRSQFAAVPIWLWAVQLIAVSLSQMVFFVLITIYAGYDTASVQDVALGNSLQAVTFSTVFAVCSIPGIEKHGGTLPLIMSTPTRTFTVIVGKSLFEIFAGLVAAAVSLSFAVAVFGVDLSNVNVLALVAVVLMTCFAMTGFGLMLSSIGIYLRSSTLLASLFLYFGLIFCGVNFPISQLPAILQPISLAIPMTYGVSALKMAADGSSILSIWPDLSAMIVIGIVMILLGFLLFNTFEEKARRKGSLEMF